MNKKSKVFLVFLMVIALGLVLLPSAVYGAEQIIDENTTGSNIRKLEEDMPSSSLYSAYGQAFNVPSGSYDYNITVVSFYTWKTGTPTGTLNAKLYAGTGTYGTNMKPTGSPLATSDNYDISSLPSSPTDFVNFTFSTEYEIASEGEYVIMLEVATGSSVDNSSNYVNVYYSSSSVHDGNTACHGFGDWDADGNKDTQFKVYGEENVAPSFSDMSHNSTAKNSTIAFSCNITDPSNVSYSIFTFNNGTGTYNQTIVDNYGNQTSVWHNTTAFCPDEYSLTFLYGWYANDTLDNWSFSGWQSFTTESAPMEEHDIYIGYWTGGIASVGIGLIVLVGILALAKSRSMEAGKNLILLVLMFVIVFVVFGLFLNAIYNSGGM